MACGLRVLVNVSCEMKAVLTDEEIQCLKVEEGKKKYKESLREIYDIACKQIMSESGPDGVRDGLRGCGRTQRIWVWSHKAGRDPGRNPFLEPEAVHELHPVTWGVRENCRAERIPKADRTVYIKYGGKWSDSRNAVPVSGIYL